MVGPGEGAAGQGVRDKRLTDGGLPLRALCGPVIAKKHTMSRSKSNWGTCAVKEEERREGPNGDTEMPLSLKVVVGGI